MSYTHNIVHDCINVNHATTIHDHNNNATICNHSHTHDYTST